MGKALSRRRPPPRPGTELTRVNTEYRVLGSVGRDGRPLPGPVGPHRLTFMSPPCTGVFFLVAVDPVEPEVMPQHAGEI